MRRAENCCHDVVVTLKSENKHSRSEVATAVGPLFVCVPAVFPANAFTINRWHNATSTVDRPPCVQRSISDELIVLNCTFRI